MCSYLSICFLCYKILQVFCIEGVWRHRIVPLAWALMESRTEVAYTALFQLLSNLLGPNIELTRVITDYEAAQQNAWENVFHVRVQGCLWHLCRVRIICWYTGKH